ncbi:hypothetical protein Godav_020169 [Gossypium davidsonii]|uniref:Uncharacterized protein n=1 Tax=Gossypium davidsonii TaxID=34287 RepID=A0A7J8R3D8_GOSDV|nr:hypothetical protein [Gossypium davidsonii]
MSMVLPIISTSSSKLPLSIPTRNKSCGVPNELEDIRLLLDQRSEVDCLQRLRCTNLIERCTSSSLCKVFCRHLKSLMNFTRSTCRREPMKIDLNSMPNISTSGNIDYITWFKLHGKLYLLSEEERSKQIHRKRPTRPHMRPRLGVHVSSSSSSPPTPNTTLMSAPPLSQYDSYFSEVGHLRNHLLIPSIIYDGNLGCKSILARKNKMKKKTMLEMKIKIKTEVEMEMEMEMEVMKMMSRNPNHDEILLVINTHRVMAQIWADDRDDF